MRLFHRLMQHPHDHHFQLFHLRRLPLAARLRHPKTLRHVSGLMLGFGMMAVGSTLALHKVHIPMPETMMDVFAYLIHGIGTFPVIKHLEPVWNIILVAE